MNRGGVSGRIGAILAAGAILIAPFIALLFRAEAGLIVMASALGATSMLLREAVGATPPRSRRWLRLAIALNASLAIVCVTLAVWLFMRG